MAYFFMCFPKKYHTVPLEKHNLISLIIFVYFINNHFIPPMVKNCQTIFSCIVYIALSMSIPPPDSTLYSAKIKEIRSRLNAYNPGQDGILMKSMER